MRFKKYLQETTTKPKPIRFEIGKTLSTAEKKIMMKHVGDVYKDHKVDLVYKGTNANGDEMYGYPYSPEFFLTSHITKKPIRFYLVLPDKSIAHPSELFPNITRTSIDNELEKRAREEEQKQAEMNMVLDTAKDAKSLTDANIIYNRLYGNGGTKYTENNLVFVKGKQHIRIPTLPVYKDRHDMLKKHGFKIALIMKNGNVTMKNDKLIIQGKQPSPELLSKYFNIKN